MKKVIIAIALLVLPLIACDKTAPLSRTPKADYSVDATPAVYYTPVPSPTPTK